MMHVGGSPNFCEMDEKRVEMNRTTLQRLETSPSVYEQVELLLAMQGRVFNLANTVPNDLASEVKAAVSNTILAAANSLQEEPNRSLAQNVAMTAVFTLQNAYMCSVGHEHIGSLFSISNAALGFGNLLADWLTLKPFGSGKTAIHVSLNVSCGTWLVLCIPLYFRVILEERKRRRKRAGFESFVLQASCDPSFTRQATSVVGSFQESSLERCEGGAQAAHLLSPKPTGIEQPRRNVVATFNTDASSYHTTRTACSTLTSTRHPLLTVNPPEWREKVQHAMKGGADNIFWVCDFDRTLTKCFLEDGNRSLDCHDILASIPKITPECKQIMEEMMEYYYPIEIHPTMTREEKIPYMVEWYAKVNFLLNRQNLEKADVAAAVAGCTNFRIRQGVEEAFKLAYEMNIPIIIVSAGLGNVIEEVVRQRIPMPEGAKDVSWPNVRVLSNTIQWDADERQCGFSEPLIHMYNKSLQDAPTEIRDMIKGRSVGMLCGDGLGDLTMAHGHQTTDVLKFGFLNEKVEERLPKYVAPDAYDCIVLNDGDFDSVLELLRGL